MLNWLKRRREQRRKVVADADELLRLFGESSYNEARDLALPTNMGIGIGPPRRNVYWDQVRREIGRRTGRNPLDTATRYLTDERGKPYPPISPLR
jgi:hypothetical protein